MPGRMLFPEQAFAREWVRGAFVRAIVVLVAIGGAGPAAWGQEPSAERYLSRSARLPAGIKPSVGTTPRPSREERDQFAKYAGPMIDPMRTLYLRARRPRLWQLKEAPFRIQVGDEAILGHTFLGQTGRELSLQGWVPGTTVLNLWFGDRQDAGRQTVLSYLVRVSP